LVAAQGAAVAWARSSDRDIAPPYGLWRPAQAAERSGLLLVLDDIQWADEPSLLLAHLVRQLRGVRMLILATCREPTPPGDRSGELIRMLPADANTERAVLHELPPVAVAALPDRPARPASQDVLRAAAVIGTSFSVGVVAQMLGVAVLALLDPVDECQAASFLVAGDRPGDYRFSHALVRSAVVAELSAADQRRWHDVAADAIERLYQDQLRPHLAELAHHRVAGSLPGDRLDAARACQAAGEAAAEDLAFEEAARLYRQALSVGAGEISEAALGQLELALAGALFRSGDMPG